MRCSAVQGIFDVESIDFIPFYWLAALLSFECGDSSLLPVPAPTAHYQCKLREQVLLLG